MKNLIKKNLAIIIFLLLFLLTAAAYLKIQGSGDSQKSQAVEGEKGVLAKQTDSQAEVEVEVTPEKLGRTEKENIFLVTLDTHTVELDFDFTQIMTLKDNLGNEYRPSAWTGGRGGHHLSGQIIFPPLEKKAQKITLVITSIGGAIRTFEWEV